ncbi:MAG TPA: F0F1 ATP synthase subunit epsilon [Pseudomonadales bacterium]|nr:F0F1 ATP synthase subunit epsilon [Pseudomonadales bacterium]
MKLRILLPFGVFATIDAVRSIVIETPGGSWGLLPRRLDCVAALAPGILSCDADTTGEVFFAVDEGVLVKTGADVRVSVRRAIRGERLTELRAAVEREFLQLDADERDLRQVMAKLETGFLHRFADVAHG